MEYSGSKLDRYERLNRIGAGAFGEINLYRDVISGSSVVGKSIKVGGNDRERGSPNLPKQVFREIQALRRLTGHRHIISLLDHFTFDCELVLMFEYMPSDLEVVIDRATTPLPEGAIKSFLGMILNGLAHMHSVGIVHRDIKPANCLISFQGELKICDFGLARPCSSLIHPESDSQGTLSHQVATRWYRAPELLYGSRSYDEKVDIWGTGAIFVELFILNPMCPGISDIDQLYRVLQMRGSPTSERWPGCSTLPDFPKISFPPMDGVPICSLLPHASLLGQHVADQLLSLDPVSRPSPRQLLQSQYFRKPPVPCPSSQLIPCQEGLVPLRNTSLRFARQVLDIS